MGYSTVRRIMREGLTDPRNLDGIALWNSTRDVTDLTTDTGIKLWADKSGNSSTNVLCLNGVAGNYASAPDSAATSIVGDLVLVAYAAPNDWTPAANQLFLSKYNTTSGNHRSYWLRHMTTGALNFAWSPDGASATSINSTATIAAADFSPLWVAVAFDVNNGAGGNDCRFYTSPDGVTWTQLGTTVTTAGVASIFDGPATVNVGANDAGAFGNFTGLIYRTQIYSGIPAAFGGAGGTLAFDANFSLPAKLATSFTESSSNAATVTINTSGATGARISGARDLYQGTAANQPILTIAASGNYLTFDGSNDYLKAAAFALAQPETVYLVGSQVTWTSTDRMTDGNAGGSMMIRQVVGTPQIGIGAGSSINGASLALGANGVITGVFNGASSSLRINRTAALTGDVGAANGGGLTLGAANDGSLNANITAQEVVVYSTAQDENYQYRVTRLLSRRTGVLVA